MWFVAAAAVVCVSLLQYGPLSLRHTSHVTCHTSHATCHTIQSASINATHCFLAASAVICFSCRCDHFCLLFPLLASLLTRCTVSSTSFCMDAAAAVLCLQCNRTGYPHSFCRCVDCGTTHLHHMGCRRIAFCRQCGSTDYVHTICDCMRCGQRHQSNRACRVRTHPVMYGAGFIVGHIDVTPHTIGTMTRVCVHCNARSWPGESINCCDNGAIILPIFPVAPPELAAVVYTNHVQEHIRAYNMALSMASVGHKSRGLNYGAFILSGKTYHRIGSMQPDAGGIHSFAQIYVLDVNEATDRRCINARVFLVRSTCHSVILQQNGSNLH